MRVLLINPGHDGSHYQHYSYRGIHRDAPPLGLLTIATYLNHYGHDVKILDTHVEQDWRDELHAQLKLKPDWVGITVIIGQFMRNAEEITQIVHREAPGIPVAWGGTMCSVMPKEVMETYKPDAIVEGPGEYRSLERSGTYVDWKRTLIPDWSLLPMNQNQVPYYNLLMTSRGCPFNCTFCYKQSIPSGKVIEMREVDSVIQEVESLRSLNGSRVFTIGDDNFLLNKKRTIAILDYFRKEGLYFEEVIGHINALDDDTIEAMRGVVQTFIFSIESVTHKMQRVTNKKLNIFAVPHKIKRLHDVGIAANVSFIAGLPDETDRDLQANWLFMKQLKHLHPWTRGNVYFWFPLPKTKLSEYAEQKYGKPFHWPIREYEDANIRVHDEHERGMFFRPHLSHEQFHKTLDWCHAFQKEFSYPNGRGLSLIDALLAGKEVPCAF